MDDADDRTRSITELQHGLITAAQAHGVGLNADAVAHRVDAGDLRWLTPRVLQLVGTPTSPVHRLLTPTLDAGAGAALSCGAALEHWGVRGFVGEHPHVIRHRDQLDHRVRGAQLHEVRFLPWRLVRILDGVPLVSPSLALLQLAGERSVATGRLERAIEAAWADRLVAHATLVAVDQLMSRQGRRGLQRFREIVEVMGPRFQPTGSNLESRFAQLLRDHGRPAMRRQVEIGDATRWIGRVDFLAEDCSLVAEVQSERFHRGLLLEQDDERRLTGLRRGGFEVVEIVEEDLFHAPAKVLAKVDEGRRRALFRRAA
jgi:very-short-patch-repair endonuclease